MFLTYACSQSCKLKKWKENILSYLPIDVNIISSLIYRWDNSFIFSYSGEKVTQSNYTSRYKDVKSFHKCIYAFWKEGEFEEEHSSQNEVSVAYN